MGRTWENLPAPLDVLPIRKVFVKGKTWGRTRQRPAMTDFLRKVNKFWQRFAKCDPMPYAHFQSKTAYKSYPWQRRS